MGRRGQIEGVVPLLNARGRTEVPVVQAIHRLHDAGMVGQGAQGRRVARPPRPLERLEDARSQGILPHQLDQGAAEGAAQQVHLKEAVLGVDPAQGEQRVAVVLRENVRDVVDVAAHADGIEEPRRLQGGGQVVFGR